MWVAPLFKGDGEIDSYVMWRQHDVYDSALRIIVTICQDYERNARAILEVDLDHECVTSLDHRTMQDAHDIMAAGWRSRWELRLRQFDLPFEERTPEEPAFMNHWLAWLRAEVRSWPSRHPLLVRTVLDILHNQHSPEGYKAEALLTSELEGFYGDVLWRPYVVAAVGRQYENPSFIRLPLLLREVYVSEHGPVECPVAEASATLEVRKAAQRGRVFNTIHL